MTDQTASAVTVAAPPAQVMAVIADFAAYPLWARGVQQTEVLALGRDGRAERVRFVIDAAPIKDEYVLAYDWDDDRTVSWTLVSGKVLKAMDGAYVLADSTAGATRVTYRLSVVVAIPMIGMLRRRAEKVIVDTALDGLRERVESGA